MRLISSVVGMVALVAAMPTAGAAPNGPPRARAGRLGAITTISWTGAAAIALDVPRTATLTGADAELLVDGGTYAFVRILGAPNHRCDPSIGPYCLVTSFTYLRAMHDPPTTGRRATSHWTVTPDPSVLATPRVGAYLFTDGRATLTLRTNLSGRTAYRAAGRFRGRVVRLPRTCVPVACAGSVAGSNSISYGGAEYDLGRRGGWAEVTGVSANADATASANQLHGIAGCLFPNPLDATVTSDPAAHEFGCDPVPQNASQVYPTVIGEFNGAPSLGRARASMLYWTAARGRQYVGYRAKSVGALPARVDAYGLWFNLGIA